MAPRSIGFWLLWTGTALAVAAAFVMNFRLAAEERRHAEAQHRHAIEERAALTEAFAIRQRAVEALGSELVAIDLTAREEYRLVRPGERMELIEVRHLGPARQDLGGPIIP